VVERSLDNSIHGDDTGESSLDENCETSLSPLSSNSV